MMHSTPKFATLQIEDLETRIVMTASPLVFASDFHDHGSDEGIVQYAAEGDSTAAGWDTGTSAPLTHRVTIQPIVVSNSDGSNTAEYFGNASEQAAIETLIDEIWAQAGIDIAWLAPNYWNNTTANVGSGSPSTARPNSDLDWVTTNGDAAGKGSTDPNILDMYFVEIAAGFPELSDNHANGLAFLGGNGITIHIGDNLVSWAGGQEVAARVAAHEIGHNLGLGHVSNPPNLMDDGELLNSSQISTALASPYSIPLPANQAPVVSNPIADVAVDEGASPSSINLATVFSDPDGDSLSYSVTNSNTGLLTASIAGSSLTLTYAANQTGTATIQVTATDPSGALVTDEFTVTVSDNSPNGEVNLGVVDFQLVADQVVASSGWYRLTASQTGTFTVQSSYSGSAGALQIDVLDQSLNTIASASGSVGAERADVGVTGGATYYVRVTGTNADLDLTLVNLVNASGANVSVGGSAGSDSYVFSPGANEQVISVNGVSYSFGLSFTTFTIQGAGEADSLQVNARATTDTAAFRPGELDLSGQGYSVAAFAENIVVQGGGGADIATFEDSAGDDTLDASPSSAKLTGAGYLSQALGFKEARATASNGGRDIAYLFDSPGDDELIAYPATSTLKSTTGSYLLAASGFDQALAHSLFGGHDVGTLFDGPTDDHFFTVPEYAFLYSTTGEFFSYGYGFDSLRADGSNGGDNAVIFNDGATNDTLVMSPGSSTFSSNSGEWSYQADSFGRVYGYATAGGNDQALLYDAATQDVFAATPVHGFMQGPGFVSYAKGFELIAGHSIHGGGDRSFLYDGATNDEFVASPSQTSLRDSAGSFEIRTQGYKEVYAAADEGGNDNARFSDSAGDDQFVAYPERGYLGADDGSFFNHAHGFDSYSATSNAGGYDSAVMYDAVGNDVFSVSPSTATLVGVGVNNSAVGFENVLGYSVAGGSDLASFSDGATSDEFTGSAEFSSMRDLAGSYIHYASNFATVEARSTHGGNDVASLFDSSGNDHVEVRSQYTKLSAPSFSYTVYGFPVVFATSSRGGTDTLDEEAVDYVFSEYGPWA